MDRKEFLNELLDAALLAPTSFNLQHFRFIDVQDEDKKLTLLNSASNWDRALVPELVLVVCGDTQVWQAAATFAQHVNREFEEASLAKSTIVYEKSPQTQRDEVNRSCGFALTNMTITANLLGKGCQILKGVCNEAVAELLNIPASHTVAAVVTFDTAFFKPLHKCHAGTHVVSENGF
ncbi:nitroreductase family protein [Pseudoalteromonas fenneropenaei]|uniref:Nitroreductase family protein n=1 Tax=Pseudoalteromonas fenneropenaei TaxID=1737459 RepID=A0ABV7CP18_9GAMM